MSPLDLINALDCISLLVHGDALSVNGDPRSGEKAPLGPDPAQLDPSIRHGPEPTRSTLSVSLTFRDHGPGFPPAKLSLRIISFHFSSLS